MGAAVLPTEHTVDQEGERPRLRQRDDGSDDGDEDRAGGQLPVRPGIRQDAPEVAPVLSHVRAAVCVGAGAGAESARTSAGRFSRALNIRSITRRTPGPQRQKPRVSETDAKAETTTAARSSPASRRMAMAVNKRATRRARR